MDGLLTGYRFTAYSWSLFFTTATALVAAWILWRRRAAPGALYLALLELAVAEWAFAIAFEAAAMGLPQKILWSKIAYLGTVSSPLFYFLFAVDYTQQANRPSSRNLVLLSIVPALTIVAAVTNEWHGWLWPDIRIDPHTHLAIYAHGVWFWIFVAYSYVLLMLSIFSLYRAFFSFPAFYRSQTVSLLVGSALPLVGNIIYLFDLGPIPGVDWTPVSLALTGIVLTWSTSRLQMFDITPIARNQLIESMMDGVLVLDARNRIVDVNPSARQKMAHTETRLIGRFAEEVIEDWPDLDLCSGDEPVAVEILSEDGESRTLEMYVTPLYDRRRRCVGRLVTLRDVTERRRAEEALRELNVTLEAQVIARTGEIRAEKEKVETILRSVGDAIALIDLEMRIQYVNNAFTTLTGYTADEVLGRSVGSVAAWPEHEKARRSIAEALAQGEIWQGEVMGRRRDGRTYDAALTVAPVRNAEGKLVGCVASQRDVTQVKNLDRARSRFITNVSHQLRTPVSTVKLLIHLLLKQATTEGIRQRLENLDRQMDRLIALIQDILEITSLDSGRAVTVWKPVYLLSVIEDAVGRYRDQARASDLSLVARPVPPGLPAIEGDQARLTQALQELVENAVIFTPAGGSVTVEARCREEAGQQWVTITVQDTGPGIPLEERERVFGRFFRGSLAEFSQVPGTGLGLSIAQEIVSAHGGKVTVESEPGQGSTFVIWLKGKS